MNEVIRTILQMLAVGGGATVLAYGAFVWLGQRWLEQQFAKDLERFRHEQAKEIEHVRHEINSLFSRVSKIHEREFEVLPAAWQKLHESVIDDAVLPWNVTWSPLPKNAVMSRVGNQRCNGHERRG
jgi:hypothetical protein